MKARRAMTDAGATPRELGAAQTHTGCVTRRHSPLLARWTGQHEELGDAHPHGHTGCVTRRHSPLRARKRRAAHRHTKRTGGERGDGGRRGE